MEAADKRRTETITNPREIYAYLHAASIFKAALAVIKSGFETHLEEAYISDTDIVDQGYFMIHAGSFPDIVKDSLELRISIYSSYIDLTAVRRTDLDRTDGNYGFRFPAHIAICYERKYFRVDPTDANPVKLRFQDRQLRGISPFIKVVDISEGGIGVRVHDAESIFKTGDLIEQLDLVLPDEGTVQVACMVRFSCEDRCGLQFRRDDLHDSGKIRNFINKLKAAESIHTKKYPYGQELKSMPRTESGKRHTILIVDDSIAIQDKYRQVFSASFEVLQSFDGLDGIKKALDRVPDLILMDVNMPKMNGLECTRVIKSQQRTRHIPICMFTTEGDQEAVVKALKFGVKDYLVKTMDAKFVIERVQNMLMQS